MLNSSLPNAHMSKFAEDFSCQNFPLYIWHVSDKYNYIIVVFKDLKVHALNISITYVAIYIILLVFIASYNNSCVNILQLAI